MMKRNVLNLQTKKEIIHSLQKGESITALSKKFKIAKSTVSAINKNKEKILSAIDNSYEVLTKKTIRRGDMPKVEEKLYEWFCVQRKKNLPVTTEILKEKAKALKNEIKEKNDFFASDGWAQKFKKRFGIRFLKVSGEKLSSSSHLVSPFKREIQDLIKKHNLSPDQIYNADESGLFWRMLPCKTLVRHEERTAPGRKADKARLTFLACTNASGEHKINLLVIGKAAKPRCFANFTLPVDYRHSKNAWMTAIIFEEWFKYSFIPQVTKYLRQKLLPIKAVLILDNAPCHPPAEKLQSEDGNIFVVYMPPNLTPLIQPMDQNIIRITKLYYKSSLLASVISSNSNDPCAHMKQLSIRDAIINLRLAWDKINSDVIKKCWVNILSTDENFDLEDNIPLSILKDKYKKDIEAPANEILNFISHLDSDFQCTIEDIENMSDNLSECENVESEEDVQMLPNFAIDTTEVLEAFNKIIIWAEENCSVDDILVFHKNRQKVLNNKIKSSNKQTKLTEYFKIS